MRWVTYEKQDGKFKQKFGLEKMKGSPRVKWKDNIKSHHVQ